MKILSLTLLVLSIFIITPRLSFAAPCSDPASVIDLDGYPFDQRLNEIQEALTNYASYPGSGRHELCFTALAPLVINDVSTIKAFVFELKGTEDVYISGLNLVRDDGLSTGLPLLTIKKAGTGKLVLENITLKNVRDGILVEGGKTFSKIIPHSSTTKVSGKMGAPVTIAQSGIEGDATKNGACVEIKLSGTVVKSSDISGCGDGVLIEANNVLIGAADAAHAEKDMNTIHDNVIGLHVASGSKNKFPYNLIHDNKQPGQDGTASDAILIESGANEDLPPLEAVLYEDNGEEYALYCTRNKAGVVLKRELHFVPPAQDGFATIYKVFKGNEQPTEYLTTCQIDHEGKCEIVSLPQDVQDMLADDQCGIAGLFVSALFTTTCSSGLMQVSAPLDGIASVVAVGEELPVTMPGASDVDIGSGGDVDIADDNEPSGGNSMGATSMAASAGAGCGGGGASLTNNSYRSLVFTFNVWWILILLSLAGAMRMAGVRARRK